MVGTIGTFDETLRADIHRRVKLTAEHIAETSGAKAEVVIEGPTP